MLDRLFSPMKSSACTLNLARLLREVLNSFLSESDSRNPLPESKPLNVIGNAAKLGRRVEAMPEKQCTCSGCSKVMYDVSTRGGIELLPDSLRKVSTVGLRMVPLLL